MAKAGLPAAVLGEDWEYGDADTRQLTHNIHRYSGKFIPQIAARAIDLLTAPGDLVVDPYCGSGTTLLECALRRRRGIGVDLSPLAVLIAKVKTTPIPRAALEDLLRTLGAMLSRVEDDPPDPRLDHPWYRKWFQPQVLADLIRIDHAIDRIAAAPPRNIARVAFSDILRRSSNTHSAYPNVMFDKRLPGREPPLRPFLQAVERIAGMVASLESVGAVWSGVSVVGGNATALPIDDGSVDAVISHPPYIGSIPYAEYGALSLQWFGADPKRLDRDLTGGRRQSADIVSRFESGYGRMLGECARILKPQRPVFLMVGNPVVRGEVVDLAAMTLDLAAEAGLDLTVRTQRTGVNRRANKMGAEHLLFFRKKRRKHFPL